MCPATWSRLRAPALIRISRSTTPNTSSIASPRNGAADTERDPAQVRADIEQMLQTDAFAPLGGLVGEKMINVLQVNLHFCKRYGSPQS
jgi:K+-transporting ATPase c subunit